MSFGDIYNGRIFVADLAAMKKADDGIPRTVAPIEEVQLYVRDAGGKRVDVSLHELIDRKMGTQDRPRRSLHQPDPRRRAAHHVETGRHHPNARS